MSDDQHKNKHTRRLDLESVSYVPPVSGTGPLDYAIPWVMELRIVGTASVLQIQVRESMVVGRSDQTTSKPDVDLEPYNAYELGVSRKHAMIYARNSRVTVRDLHSSNGTFINDGKLEADKDYRLRHGDILAFGKLQFQVFFVVTPSSHEKYDTPFNEVVIPKIGSGQKVLIVEDDHQVASALGSVLEEAGFVTSWADNVTKAITMFDEITPFATLTELMLEDRSGLDLVNYIRSKPEHKTSPIIVVSGTTGGYQMGQAIEAGVDVFLTKPVGIDELMRGFSKILTTKDK